MLSEKTIRTIQSTVPALEQYGTAITGRFYEMMFASHPELLNLFNHANQHQGRQREALANAVYAAAVHIDQLPAILPAVRHIAQKHRSLGVKPEHYPIVGKHLLAAIQEVLGEAATPDILTAWGEAYGVIADVFIGVEAQMYEESESQPGGWEGFRPFRVERKVQESGEAASFYLVPQDGGAVADFEPGQYVSVKVTIPGEAYTHIRQYSLSDAPGRPYYRITVKRHEAGDTPAGKVSVYLHRQVEAGDVLWLSAPAGEFVLAQGPGQTRPVALLSAGVGLTPLLSMLAALAETDDARPVAFIHAARSGEAHALRGEVERLAAQHPRTSVHWCYSAPTEADRTDGAYHREGHIDTAWLREVVPPEADVYMCGPLSWMRDVYRSLQDLGMAAERVRYERFGPGSTLN